MKRALICCTAVTGLLLSVGMLAGCKFNQATVSAAVKKLSTFAQTTKAALPAAAPILSDLAISEPDVAKDLQSEADKAGPLLDTLISACTAYLSNPTAGAFQSLLNATDAVVNSTDAVALKIAGIKNQASQARASAWISGVATGAHVLYAVIKSYASNAQVKAMPQMSRVPPELIRPLLDRDLARGLLAELGYDAQPLLRSEGF